LTWPAYAWRGLASHPGGGGGGRFEIGGVAQRGVFSTQIRALLIPAATWRNGGPTFSSGAVGLTGSFVEHYRGIHPAPGGGSAPYNFRESVVRGDATGNDIRFGRMKNVAAIATASDAGPSSGPVADPSSVQQHDASAPCRRAPHERNEGRCG